MYVSDILLEFIYQFVFVFVAYFFLLSSYYPIANRNPTNKEVLLFLPSTCIGVVSAYIVSEYGYFYYRTISGYLGALIISAPIYYYFHREYNKKVMKKLKDKYGKQEL